MASQHGSESININKVVAQDKNHDYQPEKGISSVAETWIFGKSDVKTMSADALADRVTKSPAAILLIMRVVTFSQRKDFKNLRHGNQKWEIMPLRWRHNERDGVSNHWRLECMLKRFFRWKSKKMSKLRVTGLCEGNPPVTGGFPSLMASAAENVSIRWLDREKYCYAFPENTVVKFHDDVIKRKHFPRYWPFVRGIHRSPVNSPHKGQRRGALMFSLIGVWINCWINNREAGDLRRYHAHYDVIVMWSSGECADGTDLLFWVSQNLIGDKSTLARVMASCRQTTNHDLSKCWPGTMSACG